MPLSGDVRIVQDGIVPAAIDLAGFDALAVGVVDTNGVQLGGFDESRPANAGITPVSVTTTSGVLQAANANRRQLLVYNDGSKEIFVAFAATASTAAFTVRIPSKGYWESVKDTYTGVVSAVASTGTQSVMVTEVTT